MPSNLHSRRQHQTVDPTQYRRRPFWTLQTQADAALNLFQCKIQTLNPEPEAKNCKPTSLSLESNRLNSLRLPLAKAYGCSRRMQAKQSLSSLRVVETECNRGAFMIRIGLEGFFVALSIQGLATPWELHKIRGQNLDTICSDLYYQYQAAPIQV